MIQPTELRLGNLVQGALGEIMMVTELAQERMKASCINGSGFATAPAFEGILITEEWLIRMGFEKLFKSNIHSRYFIGGLEYFFWYLTGNQHADYIGVRIECKYVHHLQNLCFSLRGQELELKKEGE